MTKLAIAPRCRGNQGGQPCSLGDAHSLLQAIEVFNLVMVGRDLQQPRRVLTFGGEVDHPGQCQYRLFEDGATYTFSENDFFLGGAAIAVPYELWEIPPEEVEDQWEEITSRVWLAKLPAGERIEQPLIFTAWRRITSPEWGKVMYSQRGFIGHLSSGEYLSVLEEHWPGYPPDIYEVHLVITPAL